MRIDAIRYLFLTSGNELVRDVTEGVPESVRAENVLSFLRDKHGEPLDVAWTSSDELDRIDIGWVFRPSPEGLEDVGSDVELIAMPMIRDDRTGELESLFERVALMRRDFERAKEEGLLDELSIVELPHEQWRPDESPPHVHEEGQVAWIAEHADLPADVVGRVIELEFEYMVGVGIVDLPDYEFQHYTRDQLAGTPQVVDTEVVARNAESLLRIPSEVALRIFDFEGDF